MRRIAGGEGSGVERAAGWLRERHRVLVRSLLTVAALFVVLNALVHALAVATGHDHMLGLVPLLDLDAEANLPSTFGAALLLGAAGLAAVQARLSRAAGDGDAVYWFALALLMLWMSVDEVVGLHERMTKPMRNLLGAGLPPTLHFAWVLPGALLALVVGGVFLRFVQRLATPVRRRVMLAALLYLGGALGMELVGGHYAASQSTRHFTYRGLLVGIEEGMEMAGAIVLVDAVLLQLGHGRRLQRGAADRIGKPARLPERRRAPRVASGFQGRRAAVAGVGMRRASDAARVGADASTRPASMKERRR